MLTLILVGLGAALLSGGIACFVGSKFWNTEYARTNKRGDGGGPFGGVFVIMSGALVGMLLFGHVFSHWLSSDAVSVGMIVSMITSPVVGFWYAFRTKAAPKDGDKK
ncbi:MAG: hypothetical protein IT343_04230 [Candidatus Melainabacteria bacterium]|jgi:hypothetical protein|nr:hypothetical protein [Candidatus Melainabacteria bacterium]